MRRRSSLAVVALVGGLVVGPAVAALALRGSVPPLDRASAQRPRDDAPAVPAAPALARPTADGTGRPAPAGRPGPGNTGVPEGTTLTPYTGPCTVTEPGAVIEARRISCPALLVQAPEVTILASSMRRVVVDTDVDRSWSLTLTDSEVDGGSEDLPAISNGNVTVVRSDVHGGHNGLECQEHSGWCVLRDSWVHDQWRPPSGDVHLGGVMHLGSQVPCLGTGGACVEIVGNTIVCDAPVNADDGGCTGAVNLLPQWGPLTGAVVVGNHIGANPGAAYCTYAGAGMEYPATGVVYRDNVFERGSNGTCAAYGPVTNFDAAPGNVWEDNRYDDGTEIPPTR
ncbi:hypothetical protein [Nocardioides halotolerans]|jgi:hypothetical protein|uniref:hypothetical protein n=1 Tax=Nocardioides halotolerans TaxID=433660 RepID=UPI000423EEE1|nr:hypothetical protein [Nocardioides halotolerans]